LNKRVGTEKVIIIGSSGFLGDHLNRVLRENNFRVVLASSKNSSADQGNHGVIDLNKSTLEIINEVKITNPNAIVYCSSKYKGDSFKEIFYINFFLPFMLSIQCYIKDLKFIYIGTYWQLFPKYSTEFLNRYTISKFSLCLWLRILNLGGFSNCHILVIGDTFGVNDRRNKLIPYLLECERRKILPTILNPDKYINLTSINKVTEQISYLLRNSTSLYSYCINEYSLKVSDLYKLIHEIYLNKLIQSNDELFIGEYFVHPNKIVDLPQKTTKLVTVRNLVETVNAYKSKEKP
jgi:nucleoside-diphosphate-sugar epimerase